jgi:tetratricopeptide (TPR) repeat protein
MNANTAHDDFARGVRLMHEGDAAGAMAAFEAALGADPTLPEAHVNLGLLLADGDFARSRQHYLDAIGLDPHRIEAYLHLGALLASRKHFAEAELRYRQALAIDPDSAPALSNLGVLFASSGRPGQALACYRAAIAIAPDYQRARFNLSYLLLRQGDLAAGWRAFESRSWYAGMAAYFNFPRWNGEALAGKSLLISVEAGHGDMIQFCRYATLAKARGAARVGLVCHDGLKRLFGSLAGVDALYALGEAVPREGWDYWTPPLSMPYHCATTLATIPAQLPYLAPVAADCARLAPLLAAGPPLRVGLVWQGNPRFDNDGDRSIASLATLAPLATVAGVHFFSLQKGAGAAQAAAADWLSDLAPAIDDFADTAALIAGLDLVIAVDTAVAHLAGALGKPCWLLLPAYQTDWRWLTGRDDTPWYPGVMRLFRQRQPGQWDSVVEALRQALAQRVASTVAVNTP